MTSKLHYRVSFPRPENHLAEVELLLEGGAVQPKVTLAMAAWCPGSYLIRDYARFVRGMTARDRQSGAALAVVQTSKHSWEVACGDAKQVAVTYQVYGRDLSVRTNHIDRSHAFLHGPALFVALADAERRLRRDVPCEVELVVPGGLDWTVETALAPTPAGSYLAEDIDQLYDSPIHLGPVEVREFTAAERPIRLAVWGRGGESGPFGLDDLVRDVAGVIDAHGRVLGQLPCERYNFILMLAPGAYGGLEHKASSANLNSPFAFAAAKSYYDLVELLSHELFHAWNGKRLHPKVFERFDYSRENYTRCLWVVEGLTSYYDRFALRRAKVAPVSHYLTKLLEDWGRLLAIPGRRCQSLEESSWNAWVKLYKPDESNVNSTVSYYLKGGLAMTVLDLELRQRTQGKVGLDRVLRRLWDQFGAKGVGYPEDLQPHFEEAAGVALGDFFEHVIRGTGDPDLVAALDTAGLTLREAGEGDNPGDERVRPPVWLGLNTRGSGRVVSTVLDGGPSDLAGVSPGDEIIAINRFQVSGEADIRQRLTGREVGESIELALFRRGQLETAVVTAEAAPSTRFEIVARKDASDDQRARFEEWLLESHPASDQVIAQATVGGAV